MARSLEKSLEIAEIELAFAKAEVHCASASRDSLARIAAHVEAASHVLAQLVHTLGSESRSARAGRGA